MLSKEKNDFLCQVGPGTPMGEAMRRFWWPVMLSEELPTPDSDPVLVGLLGQRFVAFRDTEGRVGILDEYCCHRGASLLLGRVEECGIECIYHGWKYAVDGRLLKAPNVTSQNIFDQVRQPAYPVREEGGLIWTYIGSPENEPPFRRFWWMDLPPSHRSISAALLPFNYLSVVENQVDFAHLNFLHRDSLPQVTQYGGDRDVNISSEGSTPPASDIQETDFGFYCANLLADVQGYSKWARIDTLVLPTTVFIPPSFCTISVPVDDTTMIPFTVSYSTSGEVAERPPSWDAMPWLYEQVPGRLTARSKLSEENRYLQDRELMRNGSYTGFPGGLAQEDLALWQSMGSYPTRSMEHLVPYDRAVVMLRNQLNNLAQLAATNNALPAVMADTSRVRELEGPVDENGDWRYLITQTEHA